MNKYRNQPCVVDGLPFASKREANRYGELKLLQIAGQISDLRRQVPFELVVNGVLVCKYVADAVYVERGEQVVEDAKGIRTRDYRIKCKLMKACHGIDIREV